MRLQSIKLAGFKSFVDATTVHFASNLSAIVGPNGCGKSNIIDAVRWVMGESSAKQLRGESMADVIFNGSEARKPVGQAFIELVFDNSEGKLKGQYAGFAEVAARRLVTRDGQSHYFLNGVRCRRRDITDLFLGTGLGPRSYAIIEQGMISRLIDAKPHELRVYIEEAAGISKYKERRKETESRMNRTHENLERLRDIREELDRQLQHLKRQAGAAEKYKEYREEEREYQAQLWALNWRELDDRKTNFEQELRSLEVEQEKQVTERLQLESNQVVKREQHFELNETYQTKQQRFYELGAEIVRLEQSLKHRAERESQLTHEMVSAQEQFSLLQLRQADDQETAETINTHVLALEPELAIAQAESEESQERLDAARLAVQISQDAWDEFSVRAAEPQVIAHGEQSKIDQLETSTRRLSERLERLTLEASELDGKGVEADLIELLEQVGLQKALVQEQEGMRDDVLGRIEVIRGQNRTLGTDLNLLRDTLQTMKGRFASLEALQQAALNPSDHQAWINKYGLGQAARLAEQIVVENGWEVALETVLGSTLQALMVDDCAALAAALEEIESGSVVLLQAGESAGESREPRTLTIDLPTLGSKVQPHNLSVHVDGVYCASELRQALENRGKLGVHESIVTREGLWVGLNWIRVGKSEDRQGSVLERQRHLETLTLDIAINEAQVEEKSEALDLGRNLLTQLEAEREACQQRLSNVQRELSDLKSQHDAKEVRLEQIQHRCERLEADIKECSQQIQDEHEQIRNSRVRLESVLEQMANDSEEREKRQAERDESRQALASVQDVAHEVTRRAHALSLQVSQLTHQRDGLNARLGDAEVQIAHLSQRIAHLMEQLEGLSASDDEASTGHQLEHLLNLRSEADAHMLEAKRALDDVDHALRKFETDRGHIDVVLERVRGELERHRLHRQTIASEQQALEKRLVEVDVALSHVIETLPDDATVGGWEAQLERLATLIARLGPINLAAIDEYQAQAERKNYLDRQHEDLHEALLTLENAIRKIDRETRARFKETFDKVNDGLQALFPKVFGGGEAWLDLTGDDLLDTGVAIMACPPGKKNSTIHLLSGGEKALTAIALVFSIFQLNPAPFCLLDEVDAPLDDANVGRYCRLVSEMSSSVQFIYITHNKIAMEMAHQLMGVTMYEPGVSRLVSVDVDEATKMVMA